MTDATPQHGPLPQVTITVNIDAAVSHILLGARRVAQMSTLLMPHLAQHDFRGVVEIGPALSRMTMMPWPDPEEDRQHLESWISAAMLQELSRGVRASLEEAHLVCRLVDHDPAAPVPPTFIEDIRREAAAANTPVLLSWVNAALGNSLGFVAEMEALNRGRNCLEHGRGIVRDRDCDPGDQVMRLMMPYFALCRRDQEGQVVDVEYGVPLPASDEADDLVQIVLERRSHLFEFEVGEPLRLTRAQIEAMAMGCNLLAVDLAAQLQIRVPHLIPMDGQVDG